MPPLPQCAADCRPDVTRLPVADVSDERLAREPSGVVAAAVVAPAVARLARQPSLSQGAYYLASGAWPLVSMRTFEAVTGPKRDDWLVRPVGALAVAIGVTLLAADGDRPSIDARRLGVASALAFAAADIVGVGTRTISPIYLGDAAVELGLVAAWARLGRSGE
jgi:hypothetical protein